MYISGFLFLEFQAHNFPKSDNSTEFPPLNFFDRNIVYKLQTIIIFYYYIIIIDNYYGDSYIFLHNLRPFRFVVRTLDQSEGVWHPTVNDFLQFLAVVLFASLAVERLIFFQKLCQNDASRFLFVLHLFQPAFLCDLPILSATVTRVGKLGLKNMKLLLITYKA